MVNNKKMLSWCKCPILFESTWFVVCWLNNNKASAGQVDISRKQYTHSQIEMKGNNTTAFFIIALKMTYSNECGFVRTSVGVVTVLALNQSFEVSNRKQKMPHCDCENRAKKYWMSFFISELIGHYKWLNMPPMFQHRHTGSFRHKIHFRRMKREQQNAHLTSKPIDTSSAMQ